LLATKKKELKKLNEKIEKQTMQMLMQEEVNNNISRQLRYWQSKTKFLEVSFYKKKKLYLCCLKFFYIKSLLYILGSKQGHKRPTGNAR